jgi:hypothetical protein
VSASRGITNSAYEKYIFADGANREVPAHQAAVIFVSALPQRVVDLIASGVEVRHGIEVERRGEN